MLAGCLLAVMVTVGELAAAPTVAATESESRFVRFTNAVANTSAKTETTEQHDIAELLFRFTTNHMKAYGQHYHGVDMLAPLARGGWFEFDHGVFISSVQVIPTGRQMIPVGNPDRIVMALAPDSCLSPLVVRHLFGGQWQFMPVPDAMTLSSFTMVKSNGANYNMLVEQMRAEPAEMCVRKFTIGWI